MLAVSAKYVAALRAGAAVRVTAFADLYIGATLPPQTKAYRCVVEDGSVTADRTASTRRMCSLMLRPDAAILPSSMASNLAPNGAEIRPYFGILYPDGTQEVFGTGVFQITRAELVDMGGDLTLSVTGSDRSFAIAARKLLAAYSIAAGTNVAQAIVNVASLRWSGIPTNITPTSATTSEADLVEGADAWQQIQDLATAGAYEAFFDIDGVLTGRPVPDPKTQPIGWAFADGDGITKSITHTLDATGVSNHFVVHTTSVDVNPPVRGEASDTSATSPTNVNGAFGDRPAFIGTDYVQTSGDAVNAAANELQASLGEADQISLSLVPMPAFDVDDVVTLTRTRLGLNRAKFVVDKVTHSLRGDGQTSLIARRVS